MRPDRLYLADIVEAGTAIGHFLSGTPAYAEFVANDLVRSAVLYKLVIIGEAASKITPDFKAKYPEIPWRDIVGFRNYSIHAYFSVDWTVVWGAAKEETPELVVNIERILKSEFPS